MRPPFCSGGRVEAGSRRIQPTTSIRTINTADEISCAHTATTRTAEASEWSACSHVTADHATGTKHTATAARSLNRRAEDRPRIWCHPRAKTDTTKPTDAAIWTGCMARIIPTATAGGGPVGRGYQGMMAGCSRDRHCGRGRSGDRRAGVCGKRSDCTEPTLNQVRSCFSPRCSRSQFSLTCPARCVEDRLSPKPRATTPQPEGDPRQPVPCAESTASYAVRP